VSQRFLSVITLSAALMTAIPASAQAPPQGPRQRPERPYRGLFGGGRGDIGQSLALNVSFGGGWDDDLLAEQQGFDPSQPVPNTKVSGSYGLGSASLNYSLDQDRFTLGANVGTNGRYYPDAQDPYVASHSAGAQATGKLSERSTVSASTQMSMRQYNVIGLAPVEVSGETEPSQPLDFGLAASTQTYRSWQSAVDFRQGITRRLSGYVTYSHYVTENTSESTQESMPGWQSIGAGLSFEIARGISARGGYSVRNAAIRTAGHSQPWDGRSIDAGIDFNRSLSPSRRSKVSFSSGLTGIDDDGVARYYLTGRASFSYELGRSWTAGAGYNRDVHFAEGFGEPLQSNAFTVDVGGLIGRKLHLTTFGGGSRGKVGVASGSPNYWSVHTGASANYALTRLLAMSVSYTHYRYLFEEDAVLPAGMSHESKRQSISASLNLWLPIVQRMRKPDASR